MLILTRRIGETVMVGDDIAVKVVGVKGTQVRLGIEAPQGNRSASRGSPRTHPSRKPRAHVSWKQITHVGPA